ncbi:MAG: cytidine deaminase, partial [Candidatus Cloacimonetes bacterium]|nr:cytidine deaminase [Candidatus Cloacimonadota bacterium]
SICAKMIINAEIKVVYIAETYPDALAEELLKEAGVQLFHFDMESGASKRLL